MSILSKDEFFSQLQERLGSDTSDESIAFLENMTDTYNDMEQRANGDGTNWEQKYHELDESWKKRYRHRFFSGSDGGNPNSVKNSGEDEGSDPEEIRVEDLFTKKEDN